jgi:homopolymeric O-antigen transport system permease protein
MSEQNFAEMWQHAATENETATQVIRIEPTHGFVSLRLKELWQYRELLYFLVWRDIKVRYKQTALGAAWAIIQPLFTMLIFSVFFGRLAKVPSDGIPYPLFSFCALVPWTFFSQGITMGSNCVVQSANVVKKVYFPRLAMPIATVLAGVVDLLLAFLMLLVMLVFYRRVPTANIIWLPFLVLLAFISALGVSLWLSALNVEYRDIRHATPFLVQLWMYATPIAYPSSLLHEPWRTIFGLNPMAGVVEGFRWALLGAHTKPGPMVAVSSVAALIILVGGAAYFRRMEKTFADVV